MKRKSCILLLVITIAFLSCTSTDNIVPISDMNTDFPTAEKLDFKPFNVYDVGSGRGFIDDSVLWYFGDDQGNLGSCYDLNTGVKLSTIITKGRALNELTQLSKYEFSADSIHLYDGIQTLKTFAKKDIVSNMPMGERKFSVMTFPDSIQVFRGTKLPSGSVFATVGLSSPRISLNRKKEDGINKAYAAMFYNNEVRYYETISYDSYDIKIPSSKFDRVPMSAKEQIEISYSNGHIGAKDNNVAFFSLEFQFILCTFDLKNGNIRKEKRYSEMQGGDVFTTNEMKLRILNIIYNDKYILCFVTGFFSKEDKESRQSKDAIFVFDWDLNPKKRFDLPEGNYNYYTISNDWNSIYLYKPVDEGLSVLKADINL